MSEPSDVERAKAALRELSGLSRYHDEDLRAVLDSHDRLTRELRKQVDAKVGILGKLGSALAEVSDLRAKLAAVEAERDRQRGAAEKHYEIAEVRGAELECVEARLAELQRENERLKRYIDDGMVAERLPASSPGGAATRTSPVSRPTPPSGNPWTCTPSRRETTGVTDRCRYCRRPAERRCRFCWMPVCPRCAYVEPIKRRGRVADGDKRVKGLIVMCKRDCGPIAAL